MSDRLSFQESEHYWLRRDGTAIRVDSHEAFMRQLISQNNLNINLEDLYELAFQKGFIRVTITKNGLYIQTSFDSGAIKMTRPQKQWLVDKSEDYGFDGVIKNLMGYDISDRILFREYFNYLYEQ